MCKDMYVAMHVDLCIDMCIGMCIEVRIDTCIDIPREGMAAHRPATRVDGHAVDMRIEMCMHIGHTREAAVRGLVTPSFVAHCGPWLSIPRTVLGVDARAAVSLHHRRPTPTAQRRAASQPCELSYRAMNIALHTVNTLSAHMVTQKRLPCLGKLPCT